MQLARLIAAAMVCCASHVALGAAALDEAANAFDALELDHALDLIERYEASAGPSPRALYLRSRIATIRGQTQQARQLAGRCTRSHPQHAVCYEAAGEAALIQLIVDGGVLKKIGAARGARKSLEKAVELDPDNLRARVLLVRFYSLAPWLLGGSKAKARRQVDACRTRDPAWGEEAQALYDLAQGDAAKAAEGFAAAVDLRPKDRDPALFLARAYVADERPEAAIETLERLVGQYPGFHEAWLELGRVAADSGLHSVRGIAAFEYYLETATQDSGRSRAAAATDLGRLYLAADRRADAVRVLKDARALDRSYRPARRLLSKVCDDNAALCG